MIKDRSNSAEPASGKDFSLPRNKILKGRENFQRLFQDDAVLFRNAYVDLRFRIHTDGKSECLMGFVVRKKLGPATERNRVKRLLRESYRLNQHIINEPIDDLSLIFHGILMANTIDINLNKAVDNVVELLEKGRDHIKSFVKTTS